MGRPDVGDAEERISVKKDEEAKLREIQPSLYFSELLRLSNFQEVFSLFRKPCIITDAVFIHIL